MRKGAIRKITLLDFGEHGFDVRLRSRSHVMSNCGADCCQLSFDIPELLFTACLGEGLADPLRDRHMTSTRRTLDLAIFGVLKDYL